MIANLLIKMIQAIGIGTWLMRHLKSQQSQNQLQEELNEAREEANMWKRKWIAQVTEEGERRGRRTLMRSPSGHLWSRTSSNKDDGSSPPPTP